MTSRGSASTARPARSFAASIKARWPGWSALARAGSSGRLQPCSWLKASRSGPKVCCQPGGAMFRLLPVSRSQRAAKTCTCTPPPRSRCSTADQT